jgi:carbon-monoxide dehydrogenase small subunit
MPKVSVIVNGTAHHVDVGGSTLLVQLLRDTLGLTGTHVGCDTTQCGACTVIMDGRAVKSCTVLAAAVDGSTVQTVEGLADGDALHPLQIAFHEHHALQCGFCTPGMLMASLDLIRATGGVLDETAARHGLEGNLCRCTGYHNIIKAVLAEAARHRAALAD